MKQGESREIEVGSHFDLANLLKSTELNIKHNMIMTHEHQGDQSYHKHTVTELTFSSPH